MLDNRPQYLVKVIVIGDSGVGKTNLITRFCENRFRENYVATIGVDFKIKNFIINNKNIKMQIWDTAGQQKFKNITQTYYKGASGIILTYSISDAASFTNIQRWITQIQNNAPEDVCKVLVGTKLDLSNQRSVSMQLGEQLASKHGIKFIQVSAKTGEQVNQAFEILGREIDKKRDQSGLNSGEMTGGKKEVVRVGRWEHEKEKCPC